MRDFLHFGDIHHASVGGFLEFGIVDICTVKCHYLVVAAMARGKHKGESLMAAEVNCTSQGPLVGVYDRVFFDAAFLLSRPGLPANSLENGIGEQRDGCGIDDSELLYPSFRAIASAVR